MPFQTIDRSRCDHVCRECGRRESGSWLIADKLKANHLCFDCQYWLEFLEPRYAGLAVRVGGLHYVIGSEDMPANRKAFSGKAWRIRFFDDGHEIVSTNLWCQGLIPAAFRERLPNNAEFV